MFPPSATLYGIETVALRIFNAYGPGQELPPSYPPVIPQLLRQAQTGGSLVIFGDGAQTRILSMWMMWWTP